MATHKLALIIKNPTNDEGVLLIRQTPPPKYNDKEYDSFVDSALWDLPSAQLNPMGEDSNSGVLVEGADSCSDKFDLTKFNLDSALNEALEKAGGLNCGQGEWKFWKYVEEPEFGPGLPVQTMFIVGKFVLQCDILQEHCRWMSMQSCMNFLLEVKPTSDRVGLLVVLGLLNDLKQDVNGKIPAKLQYQEYPPGVILVPMASRTANPFHTTNLIVFSPQDVPESYVNDGIVGYGDALIVDPGCEPEIHKELKEVVNALPRKLIIFVTHHHRDHIDGLSIIQECNPNATLLAHKNTLRRISRDDWSLRSVPVSGGEEICIGGQRLTFISAPGHTDGHMALLHVSTHSLIVGDHCVGQGSALLDMTSGGKMNEYYQTTYSFLELSPHALIPMHGRINLWPKHMLSGYLKNRRSRESSILKSIENGAQTWLDVVSNTYSGVDRKFWIAAASNVRLHVDHLAQQNKLPKDFSVEAFNGSWDRFVDEMNKWKV